LLEGEKVSFSFHGRRHIHILGWHFQLILAKSEKSTQGNIRVCDVMLTCGDELEIIAFLQDCTIVRRDIQTIANRIVMRDVDLRPGQVLTIVPQRNLSPDRSQYDSSL
jgi:hypothetical protein